ncbi:hypothetical protein Pcinc_007706 [Petrolisthes cinctipes]|uniref:Uncharacterized protein n=1 Tax=Petrolisthes cinctipes TaxID=88211 RepID=A0AAE1GAL0_PETCI|nr:hypothetical protein Pcinc_007706 [Petrolisthes cinctipes]
MTTQPPTATTTTADHYPRPRCHPHRHIHPSAIHHPLSSTTRCHPPPITLTTTLFHPSIHPSTIHNLMPPTTWHHPQSASVHLSSHPSIHYPQPNATYNLASSTTCLHPPQQPSIHPSLVLVTIHPASVPDPNLWDHPGWLADWLAGVQTH